MKVLLTGASGFVGSHILDTLCSRRIPAAILLRSNSNRRFVQSHLPEVEIREGSLAEPTSLQSALQGITHVLHCAGSTKARNSAEFFEVNHGGTKNLLHAVKAQVPNLENFVHISSLAAVGPATAEAPATESDSPHPISGYGQSKLAAEEEVRKTGAGKFVILRPPAVYGPRDIEFFRIFRAVKNHILPRTNAAQQLSLVFVKDLAEVAVGCLQSAAALGKTYFVAAEEIATGRKMAEEIAAQFRTWTVPLPLPTPMLWPVCLAQDVMTRLTGKANVLSLQKYAELRAPGWVCDSSRLKRDTGMSCPTTLSKGIAETLDWYRREGWV